MPTYVYKCDNCEYSFEARQRMTDDPLTYCPQCEEESVRRVINSVGIVFKGKGFYVTDNRNGKRADSGAGDSAGTGDSAKGDSDANGSPAGESNGTGGGSTASADKSTTSGSEKKAEGSSSKKSSSG